MPHAIKLQQKYGAQGLKVILVHCQEYGDLPAFMMRKFPANEAMVTADNPVLIGTTQGFGLPRAALVGVDGRVLCDGLRAKVGARIDKLIPKELARMRKGWGAHPQLERARALLYGKGNLAGARKIVETFEASPENQADHSSLKEELLVRYDRLLKAVEYRIAEGAWSRAKAAGRSLAKGVRGVETWEKGVADVTEKLRQPSVSAEMVRDRRIAKVLRAIRKSGPKPKHEKALWAIAGKNPESPTGARAKRLARLVQRSLDL